MNKLTKIIAALLILLAVVLAAIAWWMGRQIPEPTPAPVAVAAPSYPAVIAAAQLANGKRIEEHELQLIESPRPIPGSYKSISSVAGRIAANDIAPDTLITESNLVQGIALQLANGERALALPVDEVVGVGNKLQPGDYVDVFMTLKPGSHIEKGQARLLASRLRVLSYGTQVIGSSEDNKETPIRKTSSSSQPRTAVLATPVEEVNSLLLAAQNGKLALALRHPGDNGMADSTLFPQAAAILPSKNGLPRDEKEALQTPDNRAFAGIDVATWSTDKPRRDHQQRTTVRTGSAPHRTLEVIKGTQRQQVRF